ncbi:toprim domain-containing protein [Phenylobacterium terrae]|uniref:Toprim domain-containing protein n=1 Tax=Phenylobacterium terrae TaxID=2665495 RepID=A0ABW4N5Z2_9CAUL
MPATILSPPTSGPPTAPTGPAAATLRPIVAALGGDLYAGGRRANVPAPGHSRSDRSVSLLLRPDGRVVAHGFGAVGWRETLDHLRALGLIDAAGRIAGAGTAAPGGAPPTEAARRAAVRTLWAAGGALRPWTPAARHARRRGVLRDLAGMAALRAHPAAPLNVYRPGRAARPALLAAVSGPEGAITALEVTYLHPSGARAAGLRLPRKTVGRLPAGAAVRLDPPGAELLVSEGVFSALSAGERFAAPAWALLGAGNLRRWTPPEGVQRVLIAADRGAAGEAAAGALAARLRAAGVAVRVRLPPVPYGDWNEAMAAARAAAAREEGGRAEEGARTGRERPARGPQGDRP